MEAVPELDVTRPGVSTAGPPDWRRRLAGLPGATEDLANWPTPFVVADLDLIDYNIATMQHYFTGRAAAVRPHVKTHKCAALGQLQVAAHGRGVTCSTTDEIAAMVAAGIDDVLLANVVTDRNRLWSLAQSAKKASVMVAVDSPAAAALLAEAAESADARIGVVVDFDIGMARNGATSVRDGVSLAEQVSRSPNLVVRGVMAYEGHLVDTTDRQDRRQQVARAFDPAVELLTELRRRNFEAAILTGGSTSTYDCAELIPEMTDVQAGTYVAMDETYRHLAPEFVPSFVIAASVLTSRPDGSLVVDVGVKRVGIDWGDPVLVGVEAEFSYISEEHSVFKVTAGPRPSVGDRVALMPGHCCTTLTRYRRLVGVRGSDVEAVLEVDGRDPLD